MKRAGCVLGMAVFMLVSSVTVNAKPRIYKWVQDNQVSSEQTLSRSQSSRVVSIGEAETLNIIQSVMTSDMYMALAKYHKSRNRQDAETTPDTVLPEEIIKQKDVVLIDEDYRFILEVSLKKYGDRTRIMAKARPVYRIRDLDAEASRDGDAGAANSVEVKINAAQGSGVSMGPIMVMPIFGLPSDYGINPLPDAAKRAGDMVRSFMFLLDKRLTGINNSGDWPTGKSNDEASIDSPEVEQHSGVEVKIKTMR